MLILLTLKSKIIKVILLHRRAVITVNSKEKPNKNIKNADVLDFSMCELL
jgi:hypothetical protein